MTTFGDFRFGSAASASPDPGGLNNHQRAEIGQGTSTDEADAVHEGLNAANLHLGDGEPAAKDLTEPGGRRVERSRTTRRRTGPLTRTGWCVGRRDWLSIGPGADPGCQ